MFSELLKKATSSMDETMSWCKIPTLAIFIFIALLQSVVFFMVDINLIPAYIDTSSVDKIIIVYSMTFLFAYDGKKTIRLFVTSLFATIIAFIPLESYDILSHQNPSLSQVYANQVFLSFLIPVVILKHATIHKFERYNLSAENIYHTIWFVITQFLESVFWFILVMLVILCVCFLFTAIRFEFLMNFITDIRVVKWYLPLIFAISIWNTFCNKEKTDIVLDKFSDYCLYMYWILSVIGSILILSFIAKFLVKATVFDFYHQLVVILSLGCMLILLGSYNDVDKQPSPPKLIKISVKCFNLLLPILSLLELYEVLDNFVVTKNSIYCDAAVLHTGLSWANFTPFISVIFALFLTSLNSYVSFFNPRNGRDIFIKGFWYSLTAYLFICYVFFNPIMDLNPSAQYVASCNKFVDTSYMKKIKVISERLLA